MKNNTRRNRLAGYLMGMAVMLAAGGAQAACTQVDLTGTWYAFGVSGDVGRAYLEQASRCKFAVNSRGTIIASGSSCLTRDYVGNSTASISGGSLRVNSACAVTGNVNVCTPVGCFAIRVQAAQMERTKTSFPMIGYSNVNPYWLVSLQAVKQ